MALDTTSYLLGKKSGGSGGTTNYSDLSNKPQINSNELNGNKSSSDLGLQDKLVSGTNIKTINNETILGNGNIVISGGGDSTFYYTNDQYFDIDVSDLKLGTYINVNNTYPKVRVTGLNGETQNIDSAGIFYVGKKYEDTQYDEIFVVIFQSNFSITTLKKENTAKGYDSYTNTTPFSAGLPDFIMSQIKWSIPGFSYSGTQVLKNVNGSLSWVDE